MPAPLSFQQRWLLDLACQHREWNCASGYTFRLNGLLSLDLLQRSLDEVVRRHSSLRARIVSIEGAIGQSIEDEHVCVLEATSTEGASPAQIEANATRLAEEFYELKVDPFTGPLWIARILRLNACEHWLVLVMHRLIAECSSIERVFQEVLALYRELAGFCQSTFPITPPQYVDYALWQQDTCADWERRHGGYWTGHLAETSSICWPDDPDVPPATGGPPGKMGCPFGSELSTRLREFSRKVRVLAPTVMMAVYAATLWRWTGQNDFVLPFNVAGRQTQQRPMVGYFNYVLCLRVKIAGHETFRELLNGISNEFYRALAHQDFGRIAAQRPELLQGTLFQWITWHPEEAVQQAVDGAAYPPDIAVERVPIRNFGEGLTIVPPGMSRVEITMFDSQDGLCALGTYSVDRFAQQTMDRLVEDLRSATQRFVEDPDSRLAR